MKKLMINFGGEELLDNDAAIALVKQMAENQIKERLNNLFKLEYEDNYPFYIVKKEVTFKDIFIDILEKKIEKTYFLNRYESVYEPNDRVKPPLIEEFVSNVVHELVRSEEFLDEIVSRLKRKQLK